MSSYDQPVGLVGLGLMGRGIATCLLSHGLDVYAYDQAPEKTTEAWSFIRQHLDELVERGAAQADAVAGWEERFHPVPQISDMAPATFVIEAVAEDLAVKHQLYRELEASVSADTVIASNTSSLPVGVLQAGLKHPERILVMHWAEPAWITRFMEIVRGETTSDEAVARTVTIGELCDKEPSLINFDIRGFITNRLMYAVLREACFLVDSGVAGVEDVDRSFRNDMGWWAGLAGPFRWMDLTGIHSYVAVMEGLQPELCNDTELPEIMARMKARGAKGMGNLDGFYDYTPEETKAWEEAWVEFTWDIRELVKKQEARLRDRGVDGL